MTIVPCQCPSERTPHMRSIRTSCSAKGYQSIPRSRSQTDISRPDRGRPGTFSKEKRVTQSEVCPSMAAIMPWAVTGAQAK